MQENQWTVAAQSLKKIFTSQVLSVITSGCMIVTLIAAFFTMGSVITGSASGMVGALGITALFGLGGFVVGIIGFVFYLIGLSKLSALHTAYRNAMILVIAGIVLTVLAFFTSTTVLGNILAILSPVVNALAVYFVCNATSELLRSAGDEQTAAQGGTVRTLYLVCMVINVICAVLGMIRTLAAAASLISVAASVVGIVGLVIYMVFIKKSGESLAAAAGKTDQSNI